MNKWMSLLISCCLLLTLMSPAAYASESPTQQPAPLFQDLEGHWAQKDAQRLEALGLLDGYEDGSFKPSQPISRAELIAVLDRVFGFSGQTGKRFQDVAPAAWHYDSVMRAYGSGITDGVDAEHFAPSASVTRQDAAVMLDRAFRLSTGQEPASQLNAFQDRADIAGYSEKALTYLVGEKKLKGFNGALLPKAPITRGELAVLLSGMVGDIVTESAVYSKPAVEGNLVIRVGGVTLTNTVIHGNLVLAEGIGEGSITLEGVTVTGKIIVQGGGQVAFTKGTHAEAAIVLHPLRIEVSSDSVINRLTVDAKATASQINSKGTVSELVVVASGVKVNGEEAKAGTQTSLKPEGTVTTPSTSIPTNPTNPTGPTGPAAEKPVPSTTIPDNEWQLVWNDEFNEPAIDASKWTLEDTGVVYNNELEAYNPNNAAIAKDGERSVLNIEAKKESYKGKNYTSAKLITQNKGDWTYGKMVVRAKLPVDQGMWPAFWMMPTDESHYGGWPASGEIDMMELIGGANKNRVYGTLHFDSVQPDGSHGSDQNTYDLPAGQTFNDDYHDFQVEWLPGVIRMYVDGQLYHEVTDWKTRGPGQPEDYTYPAPFDRPFYMILNLAVGGDWPGSPNADFVSDQLKVDFVRVYEYKNLSSWPDITGQPPVPTQKRVPQADGNQLYNERFTEAADGNGVPQSWQFLLNANGAGSVAVADDPAKGKVAKVSITQPGDELYSVQLTQMPMYVQKGKKYKVSFDAKADANRSIMSKVNQFQKSWKNYSGEQSLALTTSWQHYEYTFDMQDSSDNNARFEFNLGRSAETVYLANVKLVEIGDATPVPVVPGARAALPDGNLVYNGTFDQGKGRLAFWSSAVAPDAQAQISVNNFLAFPIMERQLVADVANGGVAAESVSVSQPGLPLEKNTTYGISFDAKAETARSIDVDLSSTSGNSIQLVGGRTVQLTSELKSYSKDVIIGDGADEVEAELKLLFGGAADKVYVDNVRIIKRGKPIHVDGYAHIAAAEAWEMHGLQLENASEGGKNVGYMDEGDMLQYKISVAHDADYRISARVASGEAASQIRMSVKDEAGNVIAQSNYELGDTGGWQTYKTVYFNPVPMKSGQGYYVTFEGADFNTVWVDLSENMVQNGNIDTDMNGWNLSSATASSISRSNAGELAVQVSGTGTNWWDDQVQQYNLNIVKGKTYRLELDAYASTPRGMQVFVAESGGTYAKYLEERADLAETKAHYVYTFTMSHDTDPAASLVFGLGDPVNGGAAHSVAIDNVMLYEVNPSADSGGQPMNINLLQNGSFASGTDGWFSYAAVDASQLAITAAGGKLQAAIGTVGDNPWDRQLIQEGFKIQQGSKYTLTFKAKADTPRKLGLGIGWVDVPANYAWHGYFGDQIDLTTTEQTFTFTFNATTDSYPNSRISFDMGNIPGGNAGQTAITISDVSLVNVGPAS
ncbi:carbohydrate binding domain-containing protein [Paenibacillus sp. MMS18-CY102]|uniref:carbohydrate binding domain-containing protein n=1 Tax=Paenibacillus sp. MMS18-CY102 TaxID=2682849 RepID=UPI0013660606|nr:carbohydrate binding domain-containing protein [Paenibacillus sp. MMS18-CY102]MWC29584.1 family 16 glycosylhydrolase [Paenibacillus sp. MMS18-CY102]